MRLSFGFSQPIAPPPHLFFSLFFGKTLQAVHNVVHSPFVLQASHPLLSSAILRLPKLDTNSNSTELNACLTTRTTLHWRRALTPQTSHLTKGASRRRLTGDHRARQSACSSPGAKQSAEKRRQRGPLVPFERQLVRSNASVSFGARTCEQAHSCESS